MDDPQAVTLGMVATGLAKLNEAIREGALAGEFEDDLAVLHAKY